MVYPITFVRSLKINFEGAIIRQKTMSGKILIEWKHRLCAELSRKLYMNSDITRSTHIEIANICFNQEQEDSDEISSEHSVGK